MVTPEEAIKIINQEMMITPARYNGKTVLSNLVSEAAVKALEKQVKKKPVIDPVDCAEVCPNCKSTGIRQDYGAPNDYCSDCGQAIDWGDRL